MPDLLAGIGWFFGFCGLAVLFNAHEIVCAWREVQLAKQDRQDPSNSAEPTRD